MDLFSKLKPIDDRLLVSIARTRNSALTRILKLVTYSGVGAVYFAVATLLFVLSRFELQVIPEQMLFGRCMFAALIAWLSSRSLKKHIARERPLATQALLPLPSCQSFPSGHAASAIALYVALALQNHPLSVPVLVWALLVAYSRPYLGVHYPSDIAGGSVLGVACGLVTHVLIQQF